jgi:hypothetical protein
MKDVRKIKQVLVRLQNQGVAGAYGQSARNFKQKAAPITQQMIEKALVIPKVDPRDNIAHLPAPNRAVIKNPVKKKKGKRGRKKGKKGKRKGKRSKSRK